MLQRQAQIELPRNAQRRKDVVGLVGVGIHAALFPKEAGDKAGNSSTYNWDYLKKDNGRFYYSIEGKAESRTGVDVSEHQATSTGTRFQRRHLLRVRARGESRVDHRKASQDEYFEYTRGR